MLLIHFQECSKLPFVGERLAKKIWEIVETGHLRRLDHMDPKQEAINLFNDVWGAGPTAAETWLAQVRQPVPSLSIQFFSGVIPVNGGGRIYPTLTVISPTPILHLARFMASSFTKPTLLLSFSTCFFHIFFGHPRFLLPFTSNSNAFLKTCPSSLLNICPTISLHSPLPSEPLFPSIPTTQLGPLLSFSPSRARN